MARGTPTPCPSPQGGGGPRRVAPRFGSCLEGAAGGTACRARGTGAHADPARIARGTPTPCPSPQGGGGPGGIAPRFGSGLEGAAGGTACRARGTGAHADPARIARGTPTPYPSPQGGGGPRRVAPVFGSGLEGAAGGTACRARGTGVRADPARIARGTPTPCPSPQGGGGPRRVAPVFGSGLEGAAGGSGAGDGGGDGAHCFRAPKVRPRTRWRWMAMPMMTGGTAAMRPSAALAP